MARELNDAALREINKKLKDALKGYGGGFVKVGFMESAVYPDGTPVAAVAFWNEFGNPAQGRPPRPFFRNMIAAESKTWAAKLLTSLKKTNNSKVSLSLLGEDISGALTESINTLTEPKLADSTIESKGFDKPLIHAGDMMRAVTYEVTK